MDIIYRGKIYVNNVIAPMDAKVYDNFSIICEIMKEEPNYTELMEKYGDGQFPATNDLLYTKEECSFLPESEEVTEEEVTEEVTEEVMEEVIEEEVMEEQEELPEEYGNNAGEDLTENIDIVVNGIPVALKGKQKYILVDVLDFYPVDTSVAHGDHLETSVNGMACDFTMPVKSGDFIRIEWVER